MLCGHPGDGSVPPLVLIGGTAQWLDSWAGHLPAFARGRQCLAYEPRGQAGGARALAGMPDLDLTDCSLAAHASDFWETTLVPQCFLPPVTCTKLRGVPAVWQ